MKKVLFIDRDGTLIIEPPINFQVDTLEKLEFYPEVFRYLGAISRELEYELVMVTNQDGLGTPSFPEEDFWLVHNKMMKAFESEGIHFSAVHIDRSFEHEGLPTRKPGVGMLQQYIHGKYDLTNSFVIGDRKTDVYLAQNLGCKAIYITNSNDGDIPSALATDSWREIYEFLKGVPRTATIKRTTSETDIEVSLSLDGTGKHAINTGIGFFDHMLEQVAKHGSLDITISAKGDVHIDEHHTIEDVAIVLGQAIHRALGEKKGIERYGFLLPMDDCLAQVAIDMSGRAWLEWQAEFRRENIGEMPTEMFYHFFKSFSDHAQCTLNIKAEGTNEHHKIEAIFKAFAKSLKMAVAKTQTGVIPSTKGTL